MCLLSNVRLTLFSLVSKALPLSLFSTQFITKSTVAPFPLSKYFKSIKGRALFLGFGGAIKDPDKGKHPPKTVISQVKYVSFSGCGTPSYTQRSVCVVSLCLPTQDRSSQPSHEMKTTFRRSASCHLSTSALTSCLIPSSFICHPPFLLTPPLLSAVPSRLCFIYVSVESLSFFP